MSTVTFPLAPRKERPAYGDYRAADVVTPREVTLTLPDDLSAADVRRIFQVLRVLTDQPALLVNADAPEETLAVLKQAGVLA